MLACGKMRPICFFFILRMLVCTCELRLFKFETNMSIFMFCDNAFSKQQINFLFFSLYQPINPVNDSSAIRIVFSRVLDLPCVIPPGGNSNLE